MLYILVGKGSQGPQLGDSLTAIVRAYNSGGQSPFSDVSNALILPVLPGQPTGFKVDQSYTGESQYKLVWTAPSTASTSFIYSLEFTKTEDQEWKILNNYIETEFYLLDNLDYNTEYSFKLKVKNEVGTSDQAVELTIKTQLYRLRWTTDVVGMFTEEQMTTFG